MSNVTPWPNKADYYNGHRTPDTELVRAALSRLRVAVEAMKEIRTAHPLMHNGGNWNKFVDDVLTTIGPLPEGEG